jgi:hypothetical protein
MIPLLLLYGFTCLLTGFVIGWVGYWLRCKKDDNTNIYEQEFKQYLNNQ